MPAPKIAKQVVLDTVAQIQELIDKGGFKLSGSPSAAQELARRLKIDHAVIRRRLRIAADDYDTAPVEKESPPRLVMEVEVPEPKPAEATASVRRIVALEDENRRLREMMKETHREAIDAHEIRKILGVIGEAPTMAPDWIARMPAKSKHMQEVPVTIWSDWHLGEVVDAAEVNGINEYNIEIAEARVRRLVDSTINICSNHGPRNYPGMVVNLLGDFVSGGLHPELLKTDAEEVIPSTLRARDLLVWALTRMADTFGKLYVPCTSGNHGRSTPKPEFKRYVYKNFDWLVYSLLQRHFEKDDRIHFDIPAANEVHYRVFGQRYLAMHGDMMGVKGGDGIIGAIGPIMRGEIKTSRQSSTIDLEYDMLLMGHWHQPLWLPRAIVANTIKGLDEFARLALRATPSEPSQPLWFVHPQRGITSRWDVKVENRKESGRAWVAWNEEAA